MLINGEKWACDACVRGHRVSNCQHADRPLQHINKKGRPVSQCQHCRTMRKSRASHVKCDCGEKTHKCTHLGKGADGHRESCCCNHGGRCTCSHKKDQPALDTVPESEDDEETATAKCGSAKTGSWSRRRANTIHSDGTLTFDENGHHKPAHKHAKASRKSGPYQLDRVNSLNNVDSMRNRSIDNFFPSTAARDAGSDGAQSSCCGTDRSRKVKSEAASPLMTGSSALAQLNGQLPALDLSSLDYATYLANSQDAYGNFSEHDQPIFSAGLSAASVDWSHYEGLEMASKSAENLAPSNYSQTQSYGGVEFNGSEQVPTLTTATSASGDLSESDDLVINCVDSLDFDTGFQTSTNSSGFNLHQIQTDVLGTTDLTALEYDEFLKAGSRFLSASPEEQSLPSTDAMASGSFSLDDESALWMSDYTHGLPLLSDPVDPGMPSFWDAQ